MVALALDIDDCDLGDPVVAVRAAVAVGEDHLYSVAAMTSSTGAVVERYRYDAYGKRTVTNAAGTPIAASTIGQQRGFTGYYLDAETGLYYARARMYSAGLGRLVSRDPLLYVDGFGLYAAYFAPNRLDPNGTSCVYTLAGLGQVMSGPLANLVNQAVQGTGFAPYSGQIANGLQGLLNGLGSVEAVIKHSMIDCEYRKGKKDEGKCECCKLPDAAPTVNVRGSKLNGVGAYSVGVDAKYAGHNLIPRCNVGAPGASQDERCNPDQMVVRVMYNMKVKATIPGLNIGYEGDWNIPLEHTITCGDCTPVGDGAGGGAGGAPGPVPTPSPTPGAGRGIGGTPPGAGSGVTPPGGGANSPGGNMPGVGPHGPNPRPPFGGLGTP